MPAHTHMKGTAGDALLDTREGRLERDNESLDSFCLSPDAYKATEAIEFIAEHLRSEDEYIQVCFFTYSSLFR